MVTLKSWTSGHIAAKMMAMKTTLNIPAQAPFDFAGTAFSHGWVVLAPNTWDENEQVLNRVENLGQRKIVSLSISGTGAPTAARILVDVQTTSRLGKREKEELVRRVGHMFRVDEDFSVFYRVCRKRGGRWKKLSRGLGRLLRSPSLFEDMVKVICTTNIQWGGTKKMVAGLVEAYGEPLPQFPSRRAFPTAEAIASVAPGRFTTSVRMGYRAPYIHELAEQVASGKLDLDALQNPTMPTSELKKRLLVVKGIGNYAAATLLMLLGHYDELPIDTVCRDFVSKKYFNSKQPSETQIRKIYEDWGKWKFLAYWFDIWEGLDEVL
jgi:3-methyladenine DNA glycosylase/8-oxoguanine DNA glycosylase